MKKAIALFSLSAVLSMAAMGVFGSLPAKELVADGEFQTYVPLRDGWIENTDGSAATDLNGAIRARNDRFWSGSASGWDSQERSFNALDEFVDTIHKANGGEGWRGAYRTPELTLHDNDHRYISFLFGGGADDIFINIFQVRGAAGSGDRITGIRTAFNDSGYFDKDGVENPDSFNAPITCNMVFKYFELPQEIQPGEQFLIYVRDGRTGGYGGFTFGDVRINQTLEDVAKSFSAHKTQMKLNSYMSDWTKNANQFVLDYYATDSYYETVRNAEAALTEVNDGFEVNDRLTKWAYDTEYSTGIINYDSIYSNEGWKWGGYFFDNDGLMPNNISGNLFLTGEPSDTDGHTCGLPETAKYRLISPEFTLSGTGLISAKIGGHYTALQLLDSELNVIATTGDINPSFYDADMTNIASSGARLNTMVRTYLDCKEYLGQRVHVALADTQTGDGWNLSYFDEVITKYTTLPGLAIDYFTQTSSKSENKYNGYIFDKYVYDGEKSYNAAFKEAYDFLQNYFSTLRTPAHKFDYAYATSELKEDIAEQYVLLSDEAKAIVQNSDDLETIEKDDKYNTEWWFNSFVQPSNKVSVFVPDDLSTTVYSIAFDGNGSTGEMQIARKLEGRKYILPSCGFAIPEGKEFAGWKINGTGETLLPDAEITINSDITLVAQWNILKYTITYVANGGIGEDYVVNNVEHGSEYSVLTINETGITAPVGKKFVEWNTAEDGTGETLSNSLVITNNVTLYAIWEDTAKLKVEALNTETSLSYSYEKDELDNFEISNVKIRFKAFVAKALWDELDGEETIKGYGVLVSTADIEGGYLGENTFKLAYASALETANNDVDEALSALCGSGKIKNFPHDISATMPYLYEAESNVNYDEDTYAWALAQTVTSPANLGRTYVAIAYIRTNNGIIFLNEARVSAKSLAQSMIDGPDYDGKSFDGSLSYIANY